jgi:hypothetical protein
MLQAGVKMDLRLLDEDEVRMFKFEVQDDSKRLANTGAIRLR